jgi:hypothetical protein
MFLSSVNPLNKRYILQKYFYALYDNKMTWGYTLDSYDYLFVTSLCHSIYVLGFKTLILKIIRPQLLRWCELTVEQKPRHMEAVGRDSDYENMNDLLT